LTSTKLGPGDLLWAHLDGESAGAVTAVLGSDEPLRVARALARLELLQRKVEDGRWVQAQPAEVEEVACDEEVLAHALGLEVGLTTRPVVMVAGPGLLVVRLHHALGDGRTLVNALVGASGQEPVGRKAAPGKRPRVLRAARQLVRHKRGRTGQAVGKRDAQVLGPWSLEALKAGSQAQGRTLNEAFLEALDDAFEACGLERTSVGSLVELAGWGQNRFGLVLGHLDDVRALGPVRSAEHAATTAAAIALAGRLGRWATGVVVGVLSRRVDVIASNVRGPQEHVVVGGAEVTSMAFLTPLVGSVPVSVSLLSYAGEVRVAVVVDDGARVALPRFCAALEDVLGGLAGPGTQFQE
jgi:hypothetical protein